MAEDRPMSLLDLFPAIARSDVTALQSILSRDGVDIEARDSSARTPLHVAIIVGSGEICQRLLEYGADVAALTKQGETTAHLAVKRGDVEIVHTIMRAIEAKQASIQRDSNKGEQSVNVNSLTPKYKMSPLYIAVALGM